MQNVSSHLPPLLFVMCHLALNILSIQIVSSKWFKIEIHELPILWALQHMRSHDAFKSKKHGQNAHLCLVCSDAYNFQASTGKTHALGEARGVDIYIFNSLALYPNMNTLGMFT